jgi:hypothetical protein
VRRAGSGSHRDGLAHTGVTTSIARLCSSFQG